MKKITLAVITIATLAAASTAFAADEGFYLLGGVGQTTSSNNKSSLDNALTSAGGLGFSSSITKPTVYNFQAGYQLNKNLAFEGGYIGSDDSKYSASGGNLPGALTATGKIDGWNLVAVGIAPLSEQFSLLGKLGFAAIHSSATATFVGNSASTSGTKTDLTYGVGAQYNFSSAVFARLNLDSYNVGDSTSASRSTVWSVNVGYKF